MVQKSNVIQTESRCICGNGDTSNSLKNFFENKCPICGNEGSLQAETIKNVEVNSEVTTDNTNVTNNTKPDIKVVCKNCGGEFCGQDGYDVQGGRRGSLTTVSPYEITDDEDEEASTTEESETTYMSGWEGLCDLLKPLDGQAMMVQRGDYVVIKKIEMPQTARLWAYEGINVVDDSVSITDYTPEIYNTFVIKWGESFENELEFTFDKHKSLFGERKTVIEAKKIQVVSDEKESSDTEKEESDKGSGIFDVIFGGGESLSTDVNNIDTSNMSMDNIDGSGTSDGEEVPKTEEVPITDREEAIQFGLTEVGKAKREDGHTVELKVIGNSRWQMGEWCHVRLPSFNEDSYMFISKCGFESSADSEYINSLTLVDYPPSLGKSDKSQMKEEESSEEENNSDSSSGNNDSTDENNNGNDDSTNNSNTTNEG